MFAPFNRIEPGVKLEPAVKYLNPLSALKLRVGLARIVGKTKAPIASTDDQFGKLIKLPSPTLPDVFPLYV